MDLKLPVGILKFEVLENFSALDNLAFRCYGLPILKKIQNWLRPLANLLPNGSKQIAKPRPNMLSAGLALAKVF